MTDTPLCFQSQDSRLTLREGLAEYRSLVPNLLEEKDVSEGMREYVEAHDVAHVVFGCDTSGRGEIVLARWSLFGTTDSIRPYFRALAYRETARLFMAIFDLRMIAYGIRAVPAAVTAVWRSLFMTRRWPSRDYGAWLDRPLGAIRGEFNIRVIA